MAKKRHPNATGGGHAFGGDWTTSKLDVLANYLKSYTKALKKTSFQLEYIDAFAGTGYREARRGDSDDAESRDILFPDLAESGPQAYLDGSVRRALKTVPPFHRYTLIELSKKRCAELENLRSEFPEQAGKITIHQGDANTVIREICDRDWRGRRAVLFLDPYGMQVEWATIGAIADTKAIDMWLLFPLGIGVGRLLTKSGNIPAEWRRRLDLLLGTSDWYDDFYRVEVPQTLFGSDERRVVRASIDVIGRYFNDRLTTAFAGVAEKPRVLLNSTNCPLYLLCFAAANEKGAPIAVKIAEYLLEKEGG